MAANIPLHCNICPRKPNFSDVSHLLTHIASKGHLSNYYKVKVRSGSEDASRRLIESYDRWYSDWNVEELMSERMNQKDKRRSRARPAARATPAPKLEAPRPARPRAVAGSLLDPRLTEHQFIKVEHAATPTPTPQPGPVLRNRAFAAQMQYWGTESRASSRSYTNPDYETSSEYSDPGEHKRLRYTVEDSCAIEDDPVEPVAADPMAVSECTKLKGVYWPGMDIFDSATPEMRRKRNQKKDSSVVEQLEINSQDVKPTERIFTPSGTLKRERRISSSVYDDEDDSPVKLESPRPVLTRPALANMDVNVVRRPRQSARLTQHRAYATRQHHDDDEYGRTDYSYGYGDRAPKRNRAFDVYQDDDVPFSQPSGFNYLTAGFQQQPSPTSAPTLPTYKTYSNPFPYESKENVRSTLHPSYEHHHPHQPASYYHSYAYGMSQDQTPFQYSNSLYMNSAYQQQAEDDDDNRTITAPPSPSTG